LSSSAGMLIIYVVAFIAIFYFMAIRPQQRQRKAHAALLSSLKKGDHVVTASGIYGTVKRVEETLVVVEVAKGVSMKVARNAIAQIVRDGADARAFAPEPAGRRGKNAPLELEEEVPVEEPIEEVADEAEAVEEEIAEETAAEGEEEVVAEDEESAEDGKA
jgi:preprotein translocase subunit YajC